MQKKKNDEKSCFRDRMFTLLCSILKAFTDLCTMILKRERALVVLGFGDYLFYKLQHMFQPIIVVLQGKSANLIVE